MNRTVVWVFCVPLILLLLAFLAVSLLIAKSKWDLDALKVDIERRGELLSLEKFHPAVSDDESKEKNDLIKTAGRLEKIFRGGKVPGIRSPLSSGNRSGTLEVSIWREKPTVEYVDANPTWEQASTAFQPAEALIEELRQTSRRSDGENSWRFAKFENPCDWLIAASRGLSTDAMLRMREGNFPTAVSDIEAMLKICKLAKGEPLMDSLRLKLSCLTNADSCTWQMLQTRKADSHELKRLQEAWNNADVLSAVVFALRTERAGTLKSTENRVARFLDLTNSSPSQPSMEKVFFFWKVFLRHGDERQYVENMQTLIDAAVSAEVSGDWTKYPAISKTVIKNATAHFVMLLNSYGVWEAAYYCEKAIWSQTRIKMTRCAIALGRYEIDHGRFPDNIEQLVPQYLDAVPGDPYDGGKPLRYRLIASNEFALYSVGKNFTDDGGDASRPSGVQRNESKDVVWEKPAPIAPPKPKKSHSQSR